MKFLIPNYCVPDSFVDNVAYTLRKMGHTVTTMQPIDYQEYTSRLRRIKNLVINKINGYEISAQERWLLKNFKSIKPDVVLTLTQALSSNTLQVLRENNIKTIVWWGDTAANMKGPGILDDGWDLIFIKDAYAAFKFTSVGLPAFQLLEAMNPDWHKPLSKQNNEKIIVAGSFYDYRHYLVKKLLDNGIELDLFGGRLPRWADSSIRKMHTGRYIIREEKSNVFGGGLAVLNSTAMSEFNSVNCRAFEIAGAGGLQIMEYRSAVEECFEPGKELLVFKTFEELLDLIEMVKKSPREMEKIREAGYKRALSEHTYQHRLEFILNKLNELR